MVAGFIIAMIGVRSDHSTTLIVSTPLLGFILWLTTRIVRRSFRRFPPGPKGLPIIGDILHIADHVWLASPDRKDEYGEMMYVSALGRGVLIINSQRVAVDLLEKRSNIYSDRPHYISAGDFASRNLSLPMSPYGERWRRLRRAAVEGYSKSIVHRFYPIQGREALVLALAMIQSPSDPEQPFQRHASSILFSVNYDFPPLESEDDPAVVATTYHVDRLNHEMQPGTRLVEFFTWMRYIPGCLAKWKRDAEYWFAKDSLMFEGFLGKVEDDLTNGIDRPSFAASVLTNQIKYDLSKPEQAWLVGHMLVAGGETSSTTLLWWLLAMVAYPDVQDQAHAELDEVVGHARPPTFADLPSLPYIRAIVKETLRWSLTIPFGLPHATTEDDWYEGMFIPKGTVCLQNMRIIHSETDVFGSDAVQFNPNRYMDESRVTMLDGREDGHLAFGFGRRICPGRYVAEGTLAIDIATLLWAMRFECPEGTRGELKLRDVVGGRISARPVPFEYKAIPRFAEAESMLREALVVHGG